MTYTREKWLELYRLALVEIEKSLLGGRIMDVRDEIVMRVEQLDQSPELNIEERKAIAAALLALRTLDREDAKYAADQKKLADDCARTALKHLNSLKGQGSPNGKPQSTETK